MTSLRPSVVTKQCLSQYPSAVMIVGYVMDIVSIVSGPKVTYLDSRVHIEFAFICKENKHNANFISNRIIEGAIFLFKGDIDSSACLQKLSLHQSFGACFCKSYVLT